MNFDVILLSAAEQDLEPLYDHVLARELTSGGELGLADKALDTISSGLQTLAHHPFGSRMATDNPFLRELIIPFGRCGYVALFEIVSDQLVVVSAMRHQREDDYH